MRKRFGLGLLLSVACSLLVAASSSACQTANLKLGSSAAGPGDTVSFSISGILPGATYSFTIAGLQIGGTNTSSYNGVSGTFTMPDLGSQQDTVDANGESDHSDNPEPISLHDSMQYVPPAPPPPPASTSQPAPSAQPAEHSSGPSSHRPALPVAVAKHVAKEQRHDSPAIGSAVGATPADSVGSGPSPNQPSSGSGSAKHSAQHPARHSSSVPHQILKALGSTTSVGPAKVPTMGLLLMALIFIAGTGLAACVIYLSQTGPDPKAAIKAPAPLGHDPVEVELQEMIGNEMARQLLSDLELGEQVPSGPA